MRAPALFSSLLAGLAIASTVQVASAEPTEPVVIGWWSYFSNQKVDTTTSPQHQVTKFGDPNTYYYEPSGGHGLQEDPNQLKPDVAWQKIVDFTLANSQNVSLSPTFTIDTTSDLNQFTQAYFGWALVLLYVPKDKYCDNYRIHIGSVDDGLQAMANAKILGYANLGGLQYIDMVEYNSNPPNLVLRPGINEIVLIHEDQAKVKRYVHEVWIEHNGAQVPLAPKNVLWGRVSDSGTMKPIFQANVGLSGNGAMDSFATGPFGFYFFSGLANGTYALNADAAKYKFAMANGTVAMGQASTEAVRTDFALDPGCACPNGKMCGPSGGCLDPCVVKGEFGESCDDPAAVCVNHVCVKNPCDTLTCPANFQCTMQNQGMPPVPHGICVEDACTNVCCAMGQVCSAGQCVPDMCMGGCAEGQTCAGGQCVDSCTIVQCVMPLTCMKGNCVDPCKVDPNACTMSSTSTGMFTGAGGSGGGVTGTGAGVGGAGGDGNGDTVDGKSGCSCNVVGGSSETWAGLVAAALVLAASRRKETVSKVD
jgi:MYXO-CTERM domain-containing protein